MYQATGRLAVFEYGEIILTLLFDQLNFKVVIVAEIESQKLVQVPAKLVALQRGYNAHETGVFEKIVRQVVDVQFKFHAA